MCRQGKNIVLLLTCMARRRAAATSTSSIPAQSHAAAAPPPAGTHRYSTIPGISRLVPQIDPRHYANQTARPL